MTVTLFISTITSMQGLPEMAKQHLISLAKKLNATQRAQAVSKFESINKRLISNKNEVITSGSHALQALSTLRQAGLSQLKAISKKGDRDSLSTIEDQLRNIE